LLIGGGGPVKMHAISTTLATLSHIRNLRSKAIFFLGGINVLTQGVKKKKRHMLICPMNLKVCIHHLKEGNEQ
jgi:hypothetical protein